MDALTVIKQKNCVDGSYLIQSLYSRRVVEKITCNHKDPIWMNEKTKSELNPKSNYIKLKHHTMCDIMLVKKLNDLTIQTKSYAGLFQINL